MGKLGLVVLLAVLLGCSARAGVTEEEPTAAEMRGVLLQAFGRIQRDAQTIGKQEEVIEKLQKEIEVRKLKSLCS